MGVDLGNEREVQANIEALVKLHVNSVPTKVHPNDPHALEWTPTNEIDWDGSKKIQFIMNRFVPSNVYQTNDIQVFTEWDSLKQLGMFRDYWDNAKDLLLLDGSPVMVRENSQSGPSQGKLKVLRVIEKDGLKEMYCVDLLQADNLTAIENPLYSTRVTENNLEYIYPAVVRVKDLRDSIKDIDSKIGNKVAVRFFAFGNLDPEEAKRQSLKPLIAAAEKKIWTN